MRIDDNIILCADKCSKGKKCLLNKDFVYCKVERCLNNNVLFISCKEETECNYQIQYGHCIVCRCPIRIEIYNKYNK